MNSEFKTLTGDEVNGFNSIIELYGFSIDDFEITEIWHSTDNMALLDNLMFNKEFNRDSVITVNTIFR